MSTSSKVAEIKEAVLAYEHTPYTRCLPLAQHSFLQLIPVVGNVIVFFQTSLLVRRINKLVPISRHERVETWASVYILLVVGMIPLLGLWLTIYCTHCSDHLLLALRQLKTVDAQNRGPADLEEGTKDAPLSPIVTAEAAADSLMMSPIANPAAVAISIHSISRAPSSASSKKSVREKPTSSHKTTKDKPTSGRKITKDKPTSSRKSSKDRPADLQPPRPPTERKHSVFDRVSKMPWMEEVMATSPTDDYRTSLSVSAMQTHRKTRYDNLHDLATRNSKMTTASLDNIPLYLAAGHPSLYAQDDMLHNSKRMTRSLLIDDGALDGQMASPPRPVDFRHRPDYSHPSPRSAVTKSSSLVGLAPSPQLL